MTRSTKRRELLLTPNRPLTGELQGMYLGKPSVGTQSSLPVPSVRGRQVTTSSSNGWHKLRRKRKRYAEAGAPLTDIGSNFETVRSQYRSQIPAFVEAYSSLKPDAFQDRYRGPIYVRPIVGGVGDFPAVLPPDNLQAKGSTAIARVLPTNPAADAATFLGELMKEGLPSIVGAQLLNRRKGHANNVSSEYLNWQFGWAPLASGLKDFAVVAEDYEKILKQFRRDSGRNVRRRYEFPEEVETVEKKEVGVFYPQPLNSTFFTRGGTMTTTTRKSRKVWFSGCFTYYMDPGDDALSRAAVHAQKARKLLNVELTPEVAWNLAPWSWAVDWFSNVGDVLHNMSAFQQDGLVMRYGYVMETTVHEVTYTLSDLVWKRGNGPSTISETFATIGKRRMAATPYGFGVNLDGLTTRQTAIAAALGITLGSSARRAI